MHQFEQFEQYKAIYLSYLKCKICGMIAYKSNYDNLIYISSQNLSIDYSILVELISCGEFLAKEIL
jgi:hypothetical protein